MYKSKLLAQPMYDLRWFWDGVDQFNGIANPNGVDFKKQLKIAQSEVQEILDSTNETKFMDGVIDALVTLAPFCDRNDFIINDVEDYPERGIYYYDLKDLLEEFVKLTEEEPCVEIDASWLVYKLKYVLVCDLQNYEDNVQSVLDSNLSKFIPSALWDQKYFEEVQAAYPDVHVVVEERVYKGNKFMVFFNAETGKVLKGHSYYFDPVLAV